MNSEDMLNIMYAPLSYAHPDYHALNENVKNLDQVPDCIANQILIDQLGLDTRMTFSETMPMRTQQCIDYWSLLPRICFLVGVHDTRMLLIERCLVHRLDRLARQFMLLPLPSRSVQPCIGLIDDMYLLSIGFDCICSMLRHLPVPLRQRVPLLFPKSLSAHFTTQLNRSETNQIRWRESLFSFAVTYALLDSTPIA